MEYWKLKYLEPGKRRRAIGNLKSLRRFLDAQLPKRTAQETLVLGTWNIRNFDNNHFGNGPRLEETFLYIAEVISGFDAIAVQEICRDLRPLDRLMSILGDEYRFILTGVTEGSSGNQERLKFIYHRDKVSFQGIAGEVVLPEKLLISDVEVALAVKLAVMDAEQKTWEAKKPSKTRTKELASLAKKTPAPDKSVPRSACAKPTISTRGARSK